MWIHNQLASIHRGDSHGSSPLGIPGLQTLLKESNLGFPWLLPLLSAPGFVSWPQVPGSTWDT